MSLKKNIKNNQGFSLIEILIALTLLGIIATFVGGKVIQQLEEGSIQATNIQIQNFAARLKEFKRHCFFYPTSEQGLEALLEKPTQGRECKNYAPGGYIDGDEIPLDPWKGPYIYVSEGSKFNITSFGPDGLEETEDDISYRKKKNNR